MNIDTVSELIQSLESAGELSIKERKYLELAKAYADKEAESVAQALTFEKCRELSGCPAGVDLQDWVRQLAEESLSIKAMNDCLSEELRGYESDGAFDGPKMHLLWWQVETPATDAYLAGIKADGVSEFISRLQQCVDEGDFVGDEVAVIVGAIDCGKEFCEQLREGADK